MPDITCELAQPSERLACLALLPEARGLAAEWLIARRGGAFAGAAALFWRSWSRPGGFPIWLRIPAEHRRRGVGRSLADRAKALARGETAGLWAMSPVRSGSEAALFLEACGFDGRRREYHFQADIRIMLQIVGAKADRARASGGPAARAQLADLAEAHLEEVSWLISAAMGGGPLANLRGARQRLNTPQNAPKGDDWRGSQVALVDGEVAGAILWRIDRGVAVIDMAVVAERWRGHRLTPIMMEHCMRLCLAEGIGIGRFHAEEGVEDTFQLARRLGSGGIPAEVRYYCPLPTPA